MDWVNRQLEEVANKLTSLSTLYLIMPDTSGVFDGGWDGFPDKLEQAYAGGKNSGEKVAGSAEVGRTVSGVKSAYEFMSRLPILKFEKTTIDINLPLIPGEEEASKIKTELKGTIAQWQ